MDRETHIKSAKKRHECDVCWEPIEIGKPYVKWEFSSAYDSHEFGRYKFHPECHSALENNRGAFEDGDGYISLSDGAYERGTDRKRDEYYGEHKREDERWYNKYFSKLTLEARMNKKKSEVKL